MASDPLSNRRSEIEADMWENDESRSYWSDEGPEARYTRMRTWIAAQIADRP